MSTPATLSTSNAAWTISMPAGVHISQRVVQRVRVAVEGLGAGWIRDQRVGLGEAPDERVIPAGAVEVQAQRLFVILAREAFRCQGAEGAAGVAVRMVILCWLWITPAWLTMVAVEPR